MPGTILDQTQFDAMKPGPLKNPGDSWHIGNTYNMAIGQGFTTATPLQMVNAAAAIANGGTLYRPRLVDHVVGRVVPRRGTLRHAQIVQPFVPTIIRRGFIAPDNFALIQEGMHESVDLPGYLGTSYNVRDPRIDAAGKTGTAEDHLPDGTSAPDAWWVGYAPFHHPKIAVIVMVPGADAEGAYVAAPIAHKIFEDYFHLPPSKPNWVDDVQRTLLPNGGAQ
jgi:penicillin-binding protein 2